MHRYMRAIGFSKPMRQKELQKLCQQVEKNYEEKCIWARPDETLYAEISRETGLHMGITVRGEYAEDGNFVPEYYFPYFKGRNLPVFDRISVERHAEKDSYAGVCENLCLGINLIFYMQNSVEYLKYIRGDKSAEELLGVIPSALSVEGNILLPVLENSNYTPQPVWIEHSEMLERARQGDEEAIDQLALEDIDIYSTLSKRVQHEDVYSIVDTYFMPYGIECDQYSVLGTIMDVETVNNRITGEKSYILDVSCNDLQFDVCINEKDLVGEPLKGRRFKGVIWMQGYVYRA